jgi:elongation factor G
MNETLRNVALIAHGGAGKTSLAEIMINQAGLTTRVGRVEDGNTVMDFEPEELKRQSSLSSGFIQLPWKKHTISLIDTPGDQNFISDAKLCMQAADTALILVDAVDGVKVQTEQVADFASEYELPCAIFINKLDRERADFTRTLEGCSAVSDPQAHYHSASHWRRIRF